MSLRPHIIKRVLLGQPIPTSEERHQRLSKKTALSIFSSDPISSSAYATEEILVVLVGAGVVLSRASLYISMVIAVLLAIVILSYQQTIRAYPNGGGSYIVSTANLGRAPGLVAATALMIDYVMTVAVSVAAGVAAVTSALPAAYPYRVIISVVVIALVALVNLRGVRESGRVFMAPTYGFVIMAGGLIIVGIVRYFTGSLHSATAGPALPGNGLGMLGFFLLLRAFTAGCTTLTGTEAISNGVPAFKPPESRNAAITLGIMGIILGSLLLGITYLSQALHLVPSTEQTILSQLGRAVYGNGSFLYYMLQVATMAILFLAGNTSFADFPRLSYILARDGLMPRQFMNRGDKLAFSNGIIGLAVLSITIVVIFGANVTRMIPLYAVGVFVSFTLSQAGMVVHWYRLRTDGWRRRAIMNGVGSVATAIVAGMQMVTKFTEGAFIVLIAGALLVFIFDRISRHYQRISRILSPERIDRSHLSSIARSRPRTTVILFVSQVNELTARAIAMGHAIAPDDFRAVNISSDPDQADRLLETWEDTELGVPLTVVESPFREFVRPAVEYIQSLEPSPSHSVTVIIPEFIVEHWWEHVLHNQNALRLKAALLGLPWVVVTSVPFHIGRSDAEAAEMQGN
ncbi:MAG: APC family permease [Actinobacteria bacterium]|nr:APC family permease [Actinomycetota bacterium]